ncbi:MAG TPA: mycofactocin biosynthesis glycosyltransferase MftF [Acidimicrobiales bacterium]|nr:mycofactocin biosynthesis glycosyltransferase MftF [Acidimicrobiales bacterium]
MAERFPEHIALALDPSTRRSADGRSLLGGSPLRLLRFSEAGARAVDRVLQGGEIPASGPDAVVARRLLDAGIAHPRPTGAPDVHLCVVVPVRDHTAELADLLDHLGDLPAGAAVVVVDDGSTDPAAVRAVAGGRATVLRHEQALGPGPARDAGWRAVDGDVVAFLDADVVPAPGWLEPLLAHLRDPAVGLVAPRVRSRPGRSLLARYERHRSPLDLGGREARVVPRGRVSYVPTAALVVRREVLDALGGFDASMRVGEDVDLVWRAIEAGWTVRYEPAAEVVHRPRRSWAALLRQRAAYGSAAAPLDRRHPGAVAPVELNAWSLAAWALVALGGPVGAIAGVGVAAGTSLALAPKLRGRMDRPTRTAVALAGGGTLHAGTWLGRSVWRAWLPVALAGSVASRRVRRATLAAAVVPALVDRRAATRSGEPVDVDPVRWTLAHAADDAAYCAGIWRGAIRCRSARALLPRLSGIPGLTGRAESGPGRAGR